MSALARRAIVWGVLAGGMAAAAWSAESLRFRIEDVFGQEGFGKGELEAPVDVILTPKGNLAVLDERRGAIVHFSTSGSWLGTLGGGSPASPDLKLLRPAALLADARGRYWVADRGNHRVVVFSPEGALLSVVGTLGAMNGRFRSPSDVTFDPSGRAYVADTGNERLQLFRPDGTFLAAWDDRPSVRRGKIRKPTTVAYSDYGKGGIWIANEGSPQLEKFDLDGKWEESLDLSRLATGPVQVERLRIDPTFYRMFVADSLGKRILVVSRRGELVGEMRSDERGSLEPRGIFVTRSLDVFAADRAGSRVLWFRKRID